MRWIKYFMCLLVLFSVSASAGLASDETVPTLTIEQRLTGYANLWGAVKHRYVLMDDLDLDWDEVFVQFLPKVQKAKTVDEYYLVLEEMIALLKDNHSRVNSPSRKYLKRPVFRTEFIEDKPVITGLYEKDVPWPEGIQCGDIITKINNRPVQECVEKEKPYVSASSDIERRDAALERSLWGPEGNEIQLSLLRSGQECQVHVPLTMPLALKRHVSSELIEGDSIAVIHIPSFGFQEISDEFDAALEAARECPYLIIDLRDNPGGNDNTGAKVAGRIIKEPMRFYRMAKMTFTVDTMQQILKMDVKNIQELMLAKPGGPWQFEGKIAILVNRRTGSAAEDFVLGFQDSSRAIVVGEQTPGGTGNPYNVGLPGGGSARICHSKIERLDGSRFHGVGITPDVPVEQTVDGVCAGRDEILEAAITALKNN